MRKKRKWLVTFIVLLILGLLLYSCKKIKPLHAETLTIQRGNITEKVIAIGSIVPKHAISVKSIIPGRVGKLFREEGDYVQEGELLLQVTPSPTPQSVAEAYAAVKENQAIVKQAVEHKDRIEKLVKLSIETPDSYANIIKDLTTARAKLEMSNQILALIQYGETSIGGKEIKTTITSPISGYILKRNVNEGDPVVPLTEAQEGTPLFIIANMDDLIFKGVVNEIDVAKIKPDMLAEISIAALPDQKLTASLSKVSLQSNSADATKTNENNPYNVGFNVELSKLVFPQGIKLRAGYSATADIVIKEVKNVLTVPERVINFKDDKIFVYLPTQDGKGTQQEIKIGLSDGLNTEVVSGLKEGQVILSSPPTKETSSS